MVVVLVVVGGRGSGQQSVGHGRVGFLKINFSNGGGSSINPAPLFTPTILRNHGAHGKQHSNKLSMVINILKLHVKKGHSRWRATSPNQQQEQRESFHDAETESRIVLESYF